jgi:large subunit ribosomal protein L17
MAVIELVTDEYTPKSRSTQSTRTAAAPAPATEVQDDTAQEAQVEPVVAVEGADMEALEETEGGFAGKYDGSHVPLEDAAQAPEGFPIKGNEDSMKYHEPDGQWFEQTVAEVWFASAEAAEAAGFTKAGE